MLIKYKPLYKEGYGSDLCENEIITDTNLVKHIYGNVFDAFVEQPNHMTTSDNIFKCSGGCDDKANCLIDSGLTWSDDYLEIGESIEDAIRFIDDVLDGKESIIFCRVMMGGGSTDLGFDGKYFYYVAFEDGAAFDKYKVAINDTQLEDLRTIREKMLSYIPGSNWFRDW